MRRAPFRCGSGGEGATPSWELKKVDERDRTQKRKILRTLAERSEAFPHFKTGPPLGTEEEKTDKNTGKLQKKKPLALSRETVPLATTCCNRGPETLGERNSPSTVKTAPSELHVLIKSK